MGDYVLIGIFISAVILFIGGILYLLNKNLKICCGTIVLAFLALLFGFMASS